MIDDWHTTLTRRSLLLGASSLAVSSALTGCAGQIDPTLRLLVLRGSIPPQLIREFRRSFGKQLQQSEELRQRMNGKTGNLSLQVTSSSQVQESFANLQEWKRSAEKQEADSWGTSFLKRLPFMGDRFDQSIPELVTVGDYWLTNAIKQKLIAPIDTRLLPAWKQLAQIPQIKSLVTRNEQGLPDAQGSVWGAPYRVGTTMIAYRRDIFQQRKLTPPKDWSDLWRPDLRRRIVMLNQARDVIGLTLKKLGQSYNTEDLSKVPTLNQELKALQEQVLFYSSDAYLQPLLLEDVWVAVGWSTDLLPLTQRSRSISVVVPESGTALWADLWVRPINSDSPNSSTNLAIAAEWINFLWQPTIATQLSLATWALSPALLNSTREQLPEGFQEQPALLPNPKTLQASEFLLPLSEQAIAQYQKVWQDMRTP